MRAFGPRAGAGPEGRGAHGRFTSAGEASPGFVAKTRAFAYIDLGFLTRAVTWERTHFVKSYRAKLEA